MSSRRAGRTPRDAAFSPSPCAIVFRDGFGKASLTHLEMSNSASYNPLPTSPQKTPAQDLFLARLDTGTARDEHVYRGARSLGRSAFAVAACRQPADAQIGPTEASEPAMMQSLNPG